MDMPTRPTRDPYQETPVKDFSYINTQHQIPKKSHNRWLWLVSGVIIVLAAVGLFFYSKSHSSNNHKAKTTKSVVVQKTTKKTVPAKPVNSQPNIPLTTYTSTPFSLTVGYPSGWSVSAQGSTSMNIISPEMALTADNGKTVEGKIVVNVVQQKQVPTAFGTTSVAVLNSQDIAFSKPTPYQAAQTYISFIQYPSTTIIGGLDGIYVTGNNGYIKDQNIPIANIDQVSPLIYVTFEQCQNSNCSSLSNLTISSSMWNQSSFKTPILAIIESFSFS